MEGKNYISGQWVLSGSGRTFEKHNPADTNERLGRFPLSDARDVDQAVQAARAAYAGWRSRSRIFRGEVIDRFAQLVNRHERDLTLLLAKEAGKCLNEARADVTEGLHMAQFTFGRARMPHGDVLASEIAEKESYMLRKPKGVVAAISPWNFPFAIPTWLILPSLLEGNTVVFKPAEETPGIGQRVVELFEQAGLPPGVLNLVHGVGEEAGWPMVVHPEVDVVLFTGSYEVGSKIKQACAKDYRKMAACEMGGKNAIIVCDDADIELAACAAVISAYKTSGQRCTSASRLLVHESVLEAFTERFVALTKRVRIGDPLDKRVFAGPVISEAAVQKVTRYNQLAKKEGAGVLLEGGRMTGPAYDRGHFMSPFVYRLAYKRSARVLHEEVFGPHVAVIPFKDMDEAIAIHNSTDYGMAMSVITEDYRKAHRVRQECDFGVGYWNLPTIGAEVHLPFGGVKRSGTGMPSASTLIDVVTHRVSWTVNHGREIALAQGLSAKVG